jgi:hypothetical protein
MKEVDPPPALDASADTPEELRAVLRALGREAPGRGTLERVARELGPLMDAAPGLGVPMVEAARTGGKLLLARAFAALLALGGTAYLVQRAWPAASEPRAAQARVEEPRAQEAVPVAPEVAVVELPAREPELPVDAPPAVTRRERRGRHAARKELAVVLPAEPRGLDAHAPAEDTPANAQAVATAEPPAARVVEPPEPPPAQKVSEPPPDEFTLLWQARERLRRDPAGALALLDAHAGRFANGQLAPEREVLAVEVLRVLGRTSEADARLRSFRSRYPGSIHLRRLQQGR